MGQTWIPNQLGGKSCATCAILFFRGGRTRPRSGIMVVECSGSSSQHGQVREVAAICPDDFVCEQLLPQ